MSFEALTAEISALPPAKRRELMQFMVKLETPEDPGISPEDEQRLLRSLDEATSDIDSGKGVSVDEARKRVRSWAAK
ncbi:MAG TPA: hypothetical protein VGI88_13360 [Verrucomicrobiae bacterium]|jgi:hypothetical protein